MKTVFLGFVGYSGSGKTTLLEKLINIFSNKGYVVGAVKHDAHSFEIDYPGKDSYRLKHSGAVRVVLSSKEKLAVVEDRKYEKPFSEIKDMFKDCSIVFVEGYKLEDIDKIEVKRDGVGDDFLINKGVKNIILIVSDKKDIDMDVKVIDLNDIDAVVDFVENYIKENEVFI